MSVPHSDRDGSEAPKSHEGNEPETTQGASGSPSNPTDTSYVLRRVAEERLAAALRDMEIERNALRISLDGVLGEAERLRRERDGIGCSRFTCADDLGRMRDRAETAEAEVARLRAEVEHWKHHAWEAGEGFKRAIESENRARAGRRAAVAELDRLAEVVARVEALRGHLANPANVGAKQGSKKRRVIEGVLADVVAMLDANLSGPTPAETPQNGPEPALSREQGTSGQSGEGEALRGAEEGPWRARCDVPGCGWRSWPYKARVGADTAGHEHWLSKGHGTSIGADR